MPVYLRPSWFLNSSYETAGSLLPFFFVPRLVLAAMETSLLSSSQEAGRQTDVGGYRAASAGNSAPPVAGSNAGTIGRARRIGIRFSPAATFAEISMPTAFHAAATACCGSLPLP